jgi:hypothetical protein
MRFSLFTLLFAIVVIAIILAALMVVPELPATLLFVALLCLLPSVTAMLAICGRSGIRAFGIVATVFQACFWSVYQLSAGDVFQGAAIRAPLYWLMGREYGVVEWYPEMKAWVLFIGITTLLAGFFGAAIYVMTRLNASERRAKP